MTGDCRPERFWIIRGMVAAPGHMLVGPDDGKVSLIEVAHPVLTHIKHLKRDAGLFGSRHQSIGTRCRRAQSQ